MRAHSEHGGSPTSRAEGSRVDVVVVVDFDVDGDVNVHVNVNDGWRAL
jgi:hypothetical protein